MGTLSNVKDKYLINRNVLWIVNIVLLCATVLQCFALTIQGIVMLSEFKQEDILAEYYIFGIVQIACAVVNLLTVVYNRRYINMPISVTAVVVMFAVVIIQLVVAKALWELCIVPILAIIFTIINMVTQFCRSRKKEKEALVKVAKVKLGLDFQPEDMIEEYRKSLKNIEDKFDMGKEDREAFEKEKEDLMQNMHQVLKELVANSDVSLIYKLETLYQAKRECIIPEDNYLLMKNQIISNKDSVKDAHIKNKHLLQQGVITSTEYAHREELIENEL